MINQLQDVSTLKVFVNILYTSVDQRNYEPLQHHLFSNLVNVVTRSNQHART